MSLYRNKVLPDVTQLISTFCREPAWNTPVTYFSPAPPALATSPGPSAALSLLEIQQHERDAQAYRNELKMAPKSLLEIQEQERKDEKAKVAELEFQRWWAQEEARIAAEAAKSSGSQGKRKTGGATSGSGSNANAGSSQNAGRGKGKKKSNPESIDVGQVKKEHSGGKKDHIPAKKEQSGVRKEQTPAENPTGSNHGTPKPRPPKTPKAPKPPQATVAKKAAPTISVASSKVGLAPTSSSISSPSPKPASPLPGNLNPFAKPFGFVPGPPAGALTDRRS